jgi:glycosyltransferase involved in cell wall biosynthesis
VTNKHLRALVESWGADAFVLSDIPTQFPLGKPFPLNGKFNIAVINSFSPDEPLQATLEAAASVPEAHFYITGDPLRAKKSLIANQPANVTFTGFLSDEEYIGLLRSVQVVMTLTTDDHTMQRGACEAIYLGKPIITSDWPILQEYFDKGTLHVDNSAQDICEATLRMQQDWRKLEQEILILQQERWQEWEHKRADLEKLMAT